MGDAYLEGITAKAAEYAAENQPAVDTRTCTCHPSDQPPVPCPRKYALTHCRAADLGKKLRHAITTAMNDDYTKLGSEERKRHLDRVEVMSAAAAFLEDRW